MEAFYPQKTGLGKLSMHAPPLDAWLVWGSARGFFGHQGGKARDAGNINGDPTRERHDVPRTLYVELALSLVEGVDSAGEEISAVRVGGQVSSSN
jgi:hypothetical protein